LKWHTPQPSFFAYLFFPVFERRVADLDIRETEEERREVVLDELLSLAMHDQELAWVVAHESWNMQTVIGHASSIGHTTKRVVPAMVTALDPAPAALGEDDTQRAKRTEDDYLFAQWCLAILAQDAKTVAHMLENDVLDMHRTSLCFGTTAFEFAISRSSINILRLILSYRKLLSDITDDEYDLFVLTVQRSKHVDEAMDLLLRACVSSKSAQEHREIIEYFLTRACGQGDAAISEAFLDWIDHNWIPIGTCESVTQKSGQPIFEKDAVCCFVDPQKRKECLDVAFKDALLGGHILIVSRMCRYFDLSTWCYKGTALDHAVKGPARDDKVLRLLLEKGATVSQVDAKEWGDPTVLCMAAYRGSIAWIDALLQAGADPRHVRGTTDLMWYANQGGVQDKIKQLLEKYGWSADRLDIQPITTAS
jgi:hypothetical protein